VKARTLTFYLDNDKLPEALRIIDEDVIPAYQGMAHLRAIVVLRSDTSRQVVGLSLWDGDLDESADFASDLRRRLSAVAGVGSAIDTYRVLRFISTDD
jgi:hypothetical protein